MYRQGNITVESLHSIIHAICLCVFWRAHKLYFDVGSRRMRERQIKTACCTYKLISFKAAHIAARERPPPLQPWLRLRESHWQAALKAQSRRLLPRAKYIQIVAGVLNHSSRDLCLDAAIKSVYLVFSCASMNFLFRCVCRVCVCVPACLSHHCVRKKTRRVQLSAM